MSLFALLWMMFALADEPMAPPDEAPPVEQTDDTDVEEVADVDDGFAAWYGSFQAAVASGDRKAVAEFVRFPFHSYELEGRVPKKLGSPAEISRKTFLKHYKRILDKTAQMHIANGYPTIGGDPEDPWYNLGVWSGEGWIGWIIFARDDERGWVWAGTGGVSTE